MLRELPFYNELSITKTSKAFWGYTNRCSIEKIDSKNPSVQLTISKPSIEDMFEDFLDEIKGFKYQITLELLLSKYKENADREFTPAYFNSPTKTIAWSGWIIEWVDAKHVNISVYSPFSERSYIELPNNLRNSKKTLINIKNNDNKCFPWYHIRHLNPLKIHPERITKADREMINDLDCVDIKFLVSEKDYCKIEQKNNVCISVFCYENDLVYPVHVSDKKLDILLIHC